MNDKLKMAISGGVGIAIGVIATKLLAEKSSAQQIIEALEEYDFGDTKDTNDSDVVFEKKDHPVIIPTGQPINVDKETADVLKQSAKLDEMSYEEQVEAIHRSQNIKKFFVDSDYIPYKDEVIKVIGEVDDDGNPITIYKIGDGINTVRDLPEYHGEDYDR